MEMRTELFASEHFEKFRDFYEAYDKNAISVKHKIFNLFFGKEYEKHLDFILQKTKGFGCSVSNWDIDPQMYHLVSEHFIYGILASKIYETVNAMKSVVHNVESELKKEFGENYKYELVKSIGEYYDIMLHIWTVDFNMNKTTGKAENIIINKTNVLELTDVLNKFFSLSKEGQYVPDAILFSKNIIKKEEDFNAKTAEKIKIYREMITGKNVDAIVDFPKSVIFGITKSLNLNKLSIDNTELMQKYNLDEGTIKSLDRFCSYDFYIFGVEPLSIDCVIKPKRLFM